MTSSVRRSRRPRLKAASAFRSIRRSSSRHLGAADVGQHGERVEDVRRLVALAAHRLRREVRAVRLGEDPVIRHGRRRLAEGGRLRVRDVAGEGNVVPAARARSRAAPVTRSSGGRRCRETWTARRAVSASASRVWMTTGSLRGRRQLELAVRRARAARAGASCRGSSRGRSHPRRRPSAARSDRRARRPARLRPCPPGAGRCRGPRRRPPAPRRSRARPGRTRCPCRS